MNKADGDLKPVATRTQADYAGALRLLRKRPQDPEGFPKAMCVSALEENGLQTAWDEMQTLSGWRRDQGFFDQRRADQARYWFEEEVRQTLLAQLTAPGPLRDKMQALGTEVAAGETTPSLAAQEMLKTLGLSHG